MPRSGRLRVITGPMFAGKTATLLARIDRARRQRRRVLAATNLIDDRFGPSLIASHDGRSTAAHAVDGPTELTELVDSEQPELLALDEAQFFGPELIPVLGDVLANGVDVHVAGLCQTFGGEAFEPITTLMTQAEEITKLTAVCEVCGADAAFHQLRPGHDTDASGPVIGGAEMYEARCRTHFTDTGKTRID